MPVHDVKIKGRTLRYDTKNKLGEGSFAHVYRGTLARNGDSKEVKVAIKVLKTAKERYPKKTAHHQKQRDERIRKEAEQEAKIQGLFDPNTHYLDDDKRAYLTSTYEEGSFYLGHPEFNSYLKGKSLFERLTLVIALFNKIKEMHDKGVIHLDLKAKNILVHLGETVSDTTLRLIDFGLARQMREGEAEITLPDTGGSLYSAAPEAFLKEPVSPKTDIYSITPVVLLLLGVKNPLDLRIKTYSAWIAYLALKTQTKSARTSKQLNFIFAGYPVDMADIPLPENLRKTQLSLDLKGFLYRMQAPERDKRPSAAECVTFFTHYRAEAKAEAEAKAKAEAKAEAKAYQGLKGKLHAMTALTVFTMVFSGLDFWAVFSAHPKLLAHKIASIAGSATLGLTLLPLLFYVRQCPKVTPAGAVASFTVAAVLLTLSAVYEHGGLSFIKRMLLPLVFAQAGAALLVLAGMALHYTCTRPAPIAAA